MRGEGVAALSCWAFSRFARRLAVNKEWPNGGAKRRLKSLPASTLAWDSARGGTRHGPGAALGTPTATALLMTVIDSDRAAVLAKAVELQFALCRKRPACAGLWIISGRLSPSAALQRAGLGFQAFIASASSALPSRVAASPGRSARSGSVRQPTTARPAGCLGPA